jgi:hypothetical protein
MDWIHLAQDRGAWPALMNTVMNHSISTECWELVEVVERMLISQEGLSSVELVTEPKALKFRLIRYCTGEGQSEDESVQKPVSSLKDLFGKYPLHIYKMPIQAASFHTA